MTPRLLVNCCEAMASDVGLVYRSRLNGRYLKKLCVKIDYNFFEIHEM